MKIKRLIKILEKLPQDADVEYWWDSAPRSDVTFVIKHHKENKVCLTDKWASHDYKWIREYAYGEKPDFNPEEFGEIKMVVIEGLIKNTTNNSHPK